MENPPETVGVTLRTRQRPPAPEIPFPQVPRKRGRPRLNITDEERAERRRMQMHQWRKTSKAQKAERERSRARTEARHMANLESGIKPRKAYTKRALLALPNQYSAPSPAMYHQQNSIAHIAYHNPSNVVLSMQAPALRRRTSQQYSRAQPEVQQYSHAPPEYSHVQQEYLNVQQEYSHEQPKVQQYSLAPPEYSQAKPQYSPEQTEAQQQYSHVQPEVDSSGLLDLLALVATKENEESSTLPEPVVAIANVPPAAEPAHTLHTPPTVVEIPPAPAEEVAVKAEDTEDVVVASHPNEIATQTEAIDSIGSEDCRIIFY